MPFHAATLLLTTIFIHLILVCRSCHLLQEENAFKIRTTMANDMTVDEHDEHRNQHFFEILLFFL